MSVVDDILIARGYKTKTARERFLSPDYELEKHDPFLLPDMQKAVERLVKAQQAGETVVIYGDYDIDGLTASTLLLESFTKFGLQASVFIPNRFVEGYGLSGPALERLAAQGAQLVVTVDCGSLSHAEIALATTLGLEVIVTDHHTVADTMPPAVAVINPKRLLAEHAEAYEGFELKERQTGSEKDRKKEMLYPFVDLAGVGVAFKLVQALQTRLDGLAEGQEKWLLDLVALGTVCDVVELRGENRANVYWGLKVMQKTRRVGLKLLMAVARIEPEKLTARSLGFALGPRLNAAGRLETAELALDLLTASDAQRALELAQLLDTMNTERRAEQDRIFKEASQQAVLYERHNVLVVSDSTWSHGIIGIVAAKLLEAYHKPSFVLQELEDGTAKGSARSFGDFSAVGGIRATEQLLIKGGGHTLAAGVTLKTENIDAWRSAINAYHKSLQLRDQEHHLRSIAEVELDGFETLDETLMKQLSCLEPYGKGNPEPVFWVRRAIVMSRRTMGAQGQHLAYTLEKNGTSLRCLAWNAAEKFTADSGERVDAWFSLGVNEWQGRRSVEGQLLRMETGED